jgi:DNA repair protein RecN (Recombination protein N)
VIPAGRLLEVTVNDLALIRRVRLTLDPGFTVFTGETGAGKSLVVDALGLLRGGRVGGDVVRHGAAAARVEALFDRAPEPLICVREVSAGGRSVARIDDQAVTLTRLADVVRPLLEIHGQHEGQRLLDEGWQRDLLDALGGHGDLRRRVAELVETWQANQAALAALEADPREVARRLELLEHEVREINAARLRPGEAEEIRQRLAAAEHAEALIRGAGEVAGLLADEDRGARDLLARAGRLARDLARRDPRFSALADAVERTAEAVGELAMEVRRLAEAIDHDPAELARLEERLSLIYSLERRYGTGEVAILDYGRRAAEEAERLRNLETERERRRRAGEDLLAELAAAAADLSLARQRAAVRVEAEVDRALEELGFPRGSFRIAVTHRSPRPDEAAVVVDGAACAFDATGVDDVVFLFAPNPGEPARPLSRIASGGEVSRVALAIRAVAATADATPVLVFDEIDAGIGGRSAEPIGRALWRLARHHQVLCVTHLPQIAAYADAHFGVAKREADGRTITEVRRLDGEERVAELAAMLAGPSGGPEAVAAARRLLQDARRWCGGAGASGG